MVVYEVKVIAKIVHARMIGNRAFIVFHTSLKTKFFIRGFEAQYGSIKLFCFVHGVIDRWIKLSFL